MGAFFFQWPHNVQVGSRSVSAIQDWRTEKINIFTDPHNRFTVSLILFQNQTEIKLKIFVT
jgi:hypothetical protein